MRQPYPKNRFVDLISEVRVTLPLLQDHFNSHVFVVKVTHDVINSVHDGHAVNVEYVRPARGIQRVEFFKHVFHTRGFFEHPTIDKHSNGHRRIKQCKVLLHLRGMTVILSAIVDDSERSVLRKGLNVEDDIISSEILPWRTWPIPNLFVSFNTHGFICEVCKRYMTISITFDTIHISCARFQDKIYKRITSVVHSDTYLQFLTYVVHIAWKTTSTLAQFVDVEVS